MKYWDHLLGRWMDSEEQLQVQFVGATSGTATAPLLYQQGNFTLGTITNASTIRGGLSEPKDPSDLAWLRRRVREVCSLVPLVA